MIYKTIVKDAEIDGLKNWVWPATDQGLWEGPKDNWTEIRRCIEAHSPGFNTVIQAGGGAGMYPRLMAQMFANVYTFEPDGYNFHCLVQNCPEDRIKKFNCALGERHRNIVFSPPAESNRGTGVTTSPANDSKQDWQGNVPVLKVDDFIFEKVDLIYLDIEGAEQAALGGAINTIITHRPLIACENGHNGILQILERFDYIAVDRAHSDTFYKVKDGTVS